MYDHIVSLSVEDGPDSKTKLPLYCGVQRCLGGEGKNIGSLPLS